MLKYEEANTRMRMIHKLVWGIVIILTTLMVVAQDDSPPLTQTYTEPTSGITVDFPDGWINFTNEFEQDGPELSILLINSESALQVSEEVQLGDMLIQIAPTSLLNAIVGGLEFDDAWSTLIENGVFSERDDIVDIDNYNSKARFGYGFTSGYASIRGLIELDDGVYTFVQAITHPDTLDEALPIFFAIGGNLTYTGTTFNTLFASTQAFQNEARTFAFSYPENSDWIAYEEDDIAVVTNAGSIEDFTADDGQYLIIVSAVPSDEADSSALMTGMLAGLIQNIAFPLPPLMFKADGSEVESLGNLEGLVGKSVGDGFSVQTAILAKIENLPEFLVSAEGQATRKIEVGIDLVAIVSVYGSAGDEIVVNEIIDLVASSLRVPINLSSVGVSDIQLTETADATQLTVKHPEGWETFVRGSFNVEGIPPGGNDSIRLIMSGRRLEQGETVEESLRSFVQLFGYQVFDTIKLDDGRIAYIGTNVDLTEAVIEVEYEEKYVISMSFLPANPDDYMLGLPIALAILESIELKID